MTTLFAPPALLSAYAYAVDGSDPQVPLRKGTHLRVFAGMGASFPLTPFVVFKLRLESSECGLHGIDKDGMHVSDLDLAQLGTAEATMLSFDSETRRTALAEVHPFPEDGLRRAQLLDQHRRVVAERDAGRYLFSAPLLDRFRLSGDAQSVSVSTRTANLTDVLSPHTPLEALSVLGLPIRGEHPWYYGIHDREAGLNRVAEGAPTRLNAMDRPDGPLSGVGPDAEVARIAAMLSSARLAGGLEALVAKLVGDRDVDPWRQVESQAMDPGGGARMQFANVSRLGNLQMAALDPGLARFLGFSQHIDDLPDRGGEGGWDALAIVGLFAIDFWKFDPTGQHFAWLQSSNPSEGALIDMIVRALADAGGGDAQTAVDNLIAWVKHRHLVPRAAITVTAPVPPWLAPSLPPPAIVQRRWQPAVGGVPSARYRVGFAFPDAPLVAIAAMARQIDGDWLPRHGTVAVDDFDPPERATPRLFGHEHEGFSRARELRLATASARRAGLLSDDDLPADAGPVPYRFRASDFFGRFGEPVEIDVEPPVRPAPPPPVLRFHIERSTIADPTASGPISPGALVLTFAVPHPPPAAPFADADAGSLASAIAVPSIAELAAGSLQLKFATVTLAGQQPELVDLTSPGLTEVALPLPPLHPQKLRTLALTATFTDTGDVVSQPATASLNVTDMRVPMPYPTGLGLFWTSAPGPSPEVELRLSWPAAAGSLHRVYATDQHGLGLTAAELLEPVPGAAPSRGRVAQIGGNKMRAGAVIPRAGFRLLTDPPIVAGTDGRAVLHTTLPRSMETVQFLRFVPLTPEGAEAPFDKCGIVPVAVPDSRRPPLPRLDGVVDPATGKATLTVVATGFDGVALERDEPGLFTVGAAGAVAPQFRIRRAVGAVADPVYGRPLPTAGTLARDAAAAPGVVFSGSLTDDNGGPGLAPFVRYVYWADIRLPPERRLPAGVAPIDPAGGIVAVDLHNATDHPRPVSLPSPPRVLMHTPPNPPSEPLPAAIAVSRAAPGASGAVDVTITIASPPVAHVTAVGPYRLAVWTQWPGQAILPVTTANGAPLDGTWPDFTSGQVTVTAAPPSAPVAATSALTLQVAYVDPVGRMSKLTKVMVP